MSALANTRTGMDNLISAAALVSAQENGDTALSGHIILSNDLSDLMLGLINFAQVSALMLANETGHTIGDVISGIQDVAAARTLGVTPGDQLAA